MLSTPSLRDPSMITDQAILRDLLAILQAGLDLASADNHCTIPPTSDTDPQSVRDVMLHEVFIPVELSLVQSHHMKGGDDDTDQDFIEFMSHNISKWRENGIEAVGRGRLLLQTLKADGFGDGLEQALFHDHPSIEKPRKLLHLFQSLDFLGINSPKFDISFVTLTNYW
ncbi:hypothetical protein BLNAU_7689 [Blattamonas nauphoetae]|uniref:Uncharacterized protein n=1 Tax=Blattamonas nauphoetae TaxID=2049346 RepID=A0ABQ9Y0Q0_9EUKA|nr:hypothetical protein BLNAU_7689 [Blattamonas nauphoetae]